MTFAVFLPLLLKYAPEAIDVIGHVVTNIAAGRSQATIADSDWAEMDRLAVDTSAILYARLGIVPPPAAPVAR